MSISTNNIQPVRIVRNVTKRSSIELDVYRTVHEDFPRSDITLRPLFSSTLVEASQTSMKDRRLKRLPNLLAGKILPIPETGRHGLELGVTGAGFIGTHIGYRALALFLDDPEQILNSEHTEYLRRAGRPFVKPYTPHISLMNVDSFFQTSDLLTWAEEHMPPTVSLQPISSVPMSALNEEQAEIKVKPDKTKSSPHSVIRITETVRTLGPNPILDAVVKSLHTYQHAETSHQPDV